MITVESLEFRYAEGDFFLHIPELVIEARATVAFIGPSGSGKTTLLNLIAGISLPRAGRILTNDVELTSLDDGARRDFRIRNIGLVFQEFELLEYLTVLDNILLPYRINPAMQLDQTVRDRAARLADSVDIGDKLNRYATKLSQGEKQRVAVCRALLPDPPLILADEPTGNLDPNNKDRVLDILFAYATRTGATLVTVTHDHDLVGRFGRTVDFRDFHASVRRGAVA
ncbi:MAG: ABC transporter ATP-binding protein [Gemmatimonadota bacterium]|nr:MAG: ABC transporter ATP-binding protein [Gemmatimonadota bacterium]